ncbi:Cytochrome P450 6B5 [Eumeta japonica]|uniref:unspecific monooxygenase n=1 Tax=Eumeta variegata TaxID=151549 RepID=A0A4C1U2K9_EUMVA|nr:Cytochrome P450 6B5 [Eumeta japonica]
MFFENYSLNACVILMLVAALTFDYITKFFKYWYVRHVPCDAAIPGFGTDLQRVLGLRTTTEVITKLYERHPNEKFVGYIKGRIPDLIVREPEAIRSILAADGEHFDRKGLCLERSSDACLSNDLFYAEGQKCKVLRDAMEAFLKYSSWKLNWINNDMPTYNGDVCIQEEVSIFLDKLITINFFTTEDSKNIGRQIISMLRTKLQKPSPVDRIKNHILVLFPSLYVKFGFNFISRNLMDTVKKSLRNHIDNMVVRKLFDYKSFLESSKSHDKQGQLAEAEEELTISFLCSFVSNGYLPSYNVIVATLYELAKNVAIQEKARNAATSQWNDILDIHANGENYLDNVISEAMRMYPPYAVLGRVCTKTYKFPECGTLIDKGVTVTIPVAAVHRDGKHYANPETFDPTRFSLVVRQKRHVYSYIPYGGGAEEMCRKNPGSASGDAAYIEKWVMPGRPSEIGFVGVIGKRMPSYRLEITYREIVQERIKIDIDVYFDTMIGIHSETEIEIRIKGEVVIAIKSESGIGIAFGSESRISVTVNTVIGEVLSRWLIRVTVAALLRNHRLERSAKTPTRLEFVDNGHGRRLKNSLWLKMTPLNFSTT